MFTKKARRKNAPIRRQGSTGFPEGLNTIAHPSTLKNTELSELINGIYSQYGTISKRQGTTVVGQEASGGTSILSMQSVYNIDGQSYNLRISDSGVPEYLNYSTNEWNDFSGTEPDGYAGSNPPFSGGVPTFDTTYPTNIVQLHDRVYFANPVNELVYFDATGWHIYEELADPTGYITVAKTGTGTGNTRWFYQLVWYNEVGGTIASPAPDPDVQAQGTGWYGSMPQVLDSTTYLTLTLPSAPSGCTKVGLFRSNLFGEAFFLAELAPTQTTYVDKGEVETDTFAPFPEENTTKGYHFYLLDSYRGSLIGVTVEKGRDTVVWSGALEKFGSFGLPDGAGYFAYRKGDGTYINAIKTFVASNEDAVFIFKDNVFGKFQYVSTSGAFLGEGRIQDVNISVGSISPLSPHVAGNNLRFWSRDGAATVGNEANYGTILRYSVLSLRADSIAQRVTPANLEKVCGIFHKHLSLFGISTDSITGGNNSILAFDERYNAWSLWTGVYPKVFSKFITQSDKVEHLYYGSSKDANVLEMFKGKTDYATSTGTGTPITLSVTTKQYDMGLSDQFKKFDKVVIVFGDLRGGNTTVGATRADHRGVTVDSRYRIPSDSTISGFGNDEWGNQEFGMMTEEEIGQGVNIKYLNLKQKDLFWVSLNIQNDGIDDELSIIGIYFYFSQSTRPLPFSSKLRVLA